MLPLCLDQGVGVIPWSPLARGRLTRDWDATTARSRDRRVRQDAVRRTTTARSSTRWPRSPERAASARAQVALAWVLRQAGGHRADRRRDQAAATSTTPSPRSTSR